MSSQLTFAWGVKGKTTHPDGALIALFVRRGKYKLIEMRNNNILLSIPNLLNEFMIYRQGNLVQIHQYQRKFYNF